MVSGSKEKEALSDNTNSLRFRFLLVVEKKSYKQITDHLLWYILSLPIQKWYLSKVHRLLLLR